jgi:hypothetical protein
MTSSRSWRLLPAVLGLVWLLAAGNANAQESCPAIPVPADALTSAGVAFVGTVTAVADNGQTATFDVQEIWKGTNLANPITVYGVGVSTTGAAAGGRTWAVGTRYLVFPMLDKDGNLLDRGCSPTVEYTAALDALRPASAHAPQGPPTSGIPGDTPIAAVFLVIVVFGTLGVVVLWRMGRLDEDPDGA